MAEELKEAAALISAVLVLAGFGAKIWAEYWKARAGQLCLLRSEMLRIYYNNKERRALRQYEAQNFALMYEAYAARGGNSFMKEVHDHVASWEIES